MFHPRELHELEAAAAAADAEVQKAALAADRLAAAIERAQRFTTRFAVAALVLVVLAFAIPAALVVLGIRP